MKILMIVPDWFYQNQSVVALHASHLVSHLKKYVEIDLVISGKEDSKTQIDGLDAYIFKRPVTKFMGTVRRFVSGNKYLLNQIEKRLDISNYDVIYERTTLTSLVGHRLKDRHSKPLVEEFNGLLDEEAVLRRAWLKPLLPIARKRIKKICKGAEVIAVSPELGKHAVKLYDFPRPHIVDNGHSGYVSSNKQPENLVFSALGTLDELHDITGILDAFKYFPDLGMDVIGTGSMLHDYKKKYKKYTNIKFLGKLSQVDAMKHTDENVSAGIVSYSRHPVIKKRGLCYSPLKILDWAALGKPFIVIGARSELIDAFLEKKACFYLGLEAELPQLLQEIQDGRHDLTAMGAKAKEVVESYTWENAAKKTAAILNKL